MASTRVATWLDSEHRTLTERLIDVAFRGLPQMYRPATDEFAYTRAVHPERARFELRGTSLRYAAIVALGAHFLAQPSSTGSSRAGASTSSSRSCFARPAAGEPRRHRAGRVGGGAVSAPRPGRGAATAAKPGHLRPARVRGRGGLGGLGARRGAGPGRRRGPPRWRPGPAAGQRRAGQPGLPACDRPRPGAVVPRATSPASPTRSIRSRRWRGCTTSGDDPVALAAAERLRGADLPAAGRRRPVVVALRRPHRRRHRGLPGLHRAPARDGARWRCSTSPRPAATILTHEADPPGLRWITSPGRARRRRRTDGPRRRRRDRGARSTAATRTRSSAVCTPSPRVPRRGCACPASTWSTDRRRSTGSAGPYEFGWLFFAWLGSIDTDPALAPSADTPASRAGPDAVTTIGGGQPGRRRTDRAPRHRVRALTGGDCSACRVDALTMEQTVQRCLDAVDAGRTARGRRRQRREDREHARATRRCARRCPAAT